MIQRIQTLYLLLIVVCYILLFFLPLATYSTVEIENTFSLLEISSANKNSTLPLIIAVGILALGTFSTIFLYKKRVLQIKITAIILLAHIGLIAALFYVSDRLSKSFSTQAVYESGTYVVLIPLVFLVLANRAIRKDERMIRSADRLR